ncbi:hypothetical protein [Helicobacter sp.]|uniref:hypothetical protein n=1 Tax=Helicobacter sp. TaxID=218 RepID=UPI0019AFB973|nr:hypothetical protein [Helicobacter sp.]MBD5165243.1 hypothetical protein [Helicobacter sp.]
MSSQAKITTLRHCETLAEAIYNSVKSKCYNRIFRRDFRLWIATAPNAASQ